MTLDEATLHKLQRVELEMMDEVDRICRKHGIGYMLDSGSAIGAVRHKGFIPWDDDIDISMMREDYDRFIEVAKTELDPKYVVVTNENEPNYLNFHAKIRMLNTYYPQTYTKNCKYQGIQMDIFPFDYIPDDPKKAEFMLSFMRKLRVVYEVIANRNTPKNTFKRKLILAIPRILPDSFYFNLYERLSRRYNKKKTNHLTCFSYKKGRIKSHIYDVADILPLHETPFEDRSYFIMNNPDKILTHSYGDYMTLPPVEKRQCHVIGEIIFDTRGNGNQ